MSVLLLFFVGFSHNKYRPLSLESFFPRSFAICQMRILLRSRPQGFRVISSHTCRVICPVGGLWTPATFLHHFSDPDPGPSFSVLQQPRPDCCLCLSGLACPVGAAPARGFCLCSSHSSCLLFAQISPPSALAMLNVSGVFMCSAGNPLLDYS